MSFSAKSLFAMLANDTTSVFPFGKILPNFNLKNMISIYKGNFIEKIAQIYQITKNSFSKLPDFYNKFQ